MKIQRISQNNQNFKARLCGDYKTVINIVKEAKLSDGAVKYYLQKINNLVPNDNDRVFLFFRDMEVNGHPYEEHFLRSQVEILRENDPFNSRQLREQIYPFRNKPKDLLRMMFHGIERIVEFKDRNTKIPQFYYEKTPHWTGDVFSKVENKGIADFDEKGIPIKELIKSL